MTDKQKPRVLSAEDVCAVREYVGVNAARIHPHDASKMLALCDTADALRAEIDELGDEYIDFVAALGAR